MNFIASNLLIVKERLRQAALAAHREPSQIQLLAVSKTFATAAIEEALKAGQRAFGENYVQEAIEKIRQLASVRSELEWHFIGPLQSNKTREVAEYFDWVHSVDRLKIAERLSTQRAEFTNLNKLQVCVQLNISEEVSKSGISPTEAEALCIEIAKLPHLTLRGLMAIPAPSPDPQTQRHTFAQVQNCFEDIKRRHLGQLGFEYFDTLSMGMSDDMEAAIAEGSTIVRIGSAIFGKRDKIKS